MSDVASLPKLNAEELDELFTALKIRHAELQRLREIAGTEVIRERVGHLERIDMSLLTVVAEARVDLMARQHG